MKDILKDEIEKDIWLSCMGGLERNDLQMSILTHTCKKLQKKGFNSEMMINWASIVLLCRQSDRNLSIFPSDGLTKKTIETVVGESKEI